MVCTGRDGIPGAAGFLVLLFWDFSNEELKKPTQNKTAFCPGKLNPSAEKTIQAQCPSHLWGLVGPWGHLARHKKVTEPGCGVAVCHGQLRDGWEGNAVLAGDCEQRSSAEWELMIILCGVWVKQFLQTLLYSCQNKEFWCCFGLAFNGIVIEKTRVYKQSLISWKQRSSKTVRGNSQTRRL